MSFRKVGGVQYSATQNIVKNRYNTSDNLYVTQNVGEPNTYINFLSDISGNISIYGDFDLSGNLHVAGDIDCSGNVTAEYMFLSGTDYSSLPGNGVVPKSYVDTFATGLKVLPPCVLVENTNALYAPSSSTFPPSGYAYTIDGVTLDSTYIGSAILINAQNGIVADVSNGIWIVSAGTWTRPSYLDPPDSDI